VSESVYDPAVALAFFKAAGKPEDIAAGATIFAEKDRQKRIYLLLRGDVSLHAGAKRIGTVRAAEIFGELAVVDGAPRSATAVAAAPCRVIALDERQFTDALRKQPAFALMLMSTMIHRLRHTIGRLQETGGLAQDEAWKEGAAFEPQHLRDLARGLTEHSSMFYMQRAEIMAEGQTGIRMYAVLEGRVAISIGGRVVERLGPGGVFGEAALVNQRERMASAIAETDCMLLPIERKAFLALVKLSPKFANTILSSLAERLRFLTARLP
jgi:CRP/FNR family cyclic AMP-dependent transcriptional regulator